jgi:hypothetical protein
MPRSLVSLLAWVVAGTFLVGTALVYVDQLNLVATPPNLPEDVNLVDRMTGLAPYRQAIWPVFLWSNLLFGIGFVAAGALAHAVANRIPGGLPTFRALATVGGTIAAISSIIPLGAVNASVWEQYCDCGFKDAEIVSGFRAQIVAEDVGDWLGRFASVVLAIALILLVREAGRVLSSRLQLWTWLAAIALIVAPLMLTVEFLHDPSLPGIVTAIAGGILIPVWAVWLGRTVDSSTGEPSPA